ncbi:hypothetical protein [Winogradskyella immobilis]|uniref:YD repeat-containing protein n=1 Tax=Winogradskyella immobilis TaxID=2816852 RepID=A0ABS8EN42_9FLAO|nr:hypothetical protein [Winogradskyella immobilis]MCC1484412.1 hypothetical protein [Winogradskyella immobilis]MCG0016504.1 hypothetical protein [Winogradskyella immobilis]
MKNNYFKKAIIHVSIIYFYLFTILLLVGCKSINKIHRLYYDRYKTDDAYFKMADVINPKNLDTLIFNKVNVYSYNIKKNNSIKDSSLINIQFLSKVLKDLEHKTYPIITDSLGREIQKNRETRNGKIIPIYKKNYYVSSQIKEIIYYNNSGRLFRSHLHFYDASSRLSKIEIYDLYHPENPFLEQENIIIYKKNYKEQEIELHYKDDEKTLETRIINKYNPKGEKIFYKVELIDENGSTDRFYGEKYYYESNFLIEQEIFNSENITSLISYKYNKYNMPIEVKSIRKETNEVISFYRYFYESYNTKK